MENKYSFLDLLDIIATLRSDTGCPWDREQTHASLKDCMIEEAYEVCEGIDRAESTGSYENLCEELGDVMLQVVMHSQIAAEASEFTIDDVIDGVSKKMVRRHPHVFGTNSAKAASTEAVVELWDDIKKTEKAKGADNKATPLEQELLDVPKAFPALIRAQKVVKKSYKQGAIRESFQETVKEAQMGLKNLENNVANGQLDNVDEKFGDLLFCMVKMARILELNAENSLTNTTNKFINRLIDVEHSASADGTHLCELSIDELNALWDQK